MRKTGLFLASIALSATLWAELPEKKGLDVINRANAEAYIGFLASDALEGREAGFRGGRIAGEYIVSNLKTMGIEPLFESYYQPFEAYNKERQKKGRSSGFDREVETRCSSEVVDEQHLGEDRG